MVDYDHYKHEVPEWISPTNLYLLAHVYMVIMSFGQYLHSPVFTGLVENRESCCEDDAVVEAFIRYVANR